MQKDYIHKCVVHAGRPARVLVLMLALGGCGLKGDLYLPPAGGGDGTVDGRAGERAGATVNESGGQEAGTP